MIAITFVDSWNIRALRPSSRPERCGRDSFLMTKRNTGCGSKWSGSFAESKNSGAPPLATTNSPAPLWPSSTLSPPTLSSNFPSQIHEIPTFWAKNHFFVDKRKNRTILLKMFRSEMQIWQAVFRFPTPARTASANAWNTKSPQLLTKILL